MGISEALKMCIWGTVREDEISADWTPNAIKGIIITRSYIVVWKHAKLGVSYEMLNPEQVDGEIYSTRINLLSVLQYRNLSCLEELYVEDVFLRNSNYISSLDIKKYIKSLNHNTCRLRNYGEITVNPYTDPYLSIAKYLCDCMNIPEIGYKYNFSNYTWAVRVLVDSGLPAQNYMQDFSSVVRTWSARNGDWYKKYNLQPDAYKEDGYNRPLRNYFQMVAQKTKYELFGVTGFEMQDSQEYLQNVGISTYLYGEPWLKLYNFLETKDIYLAGPVAGTILKSHKSAKIGVKLIVQESILRDINNSLEMEGKNIRNTISLMNSLGSKDRKTICLSRFLKGEGVCEGLSLVDYNKYRKSLEDGIRTLVRNPGFRDSLRNYIMKNNIKGSLTDLSTRDFIKLINNLVR